MSQSQNNGRDYLILGIAQNDDVVESRFFDAIEYCCNEFPNKGFEEFDDGRWIDPICQSENGVANENLGVYLSDKNNISNCPMAQDGDVIFAGGFDQDLIDLFEFFIEKQNNTIHLIDSGIRISPGKDGRLSQPSLRALRSLAEEEVNQDRIITGIPHSGGRPPLGTTVVDGMLREGDEYHLVRRVLQRYRNGKLDQQEAADRLGCALQTVENASKRLKLYNLR